ncbi:MAG: bi-domain-containing oxidoreductase [bacterium]|nr:bi-domain-containing oxidoreductase [bacterium]
MRQLTQKLRSGKMTVLEVPTPALVSGQVMVKNHYSLISAGTEASTVKAARKSLIGKAKERPQQLRQVVEMLKTQGAVQAYRAVMKKLEAHSPLGYSCSGEVINLAQDVTQFAIGDLVACGGLTASHSEVVCVPANLCVKLAPDADLKQAAYNSLGAIAMQGVRQADLRLGETCAVIGLGLIGQLCALLLRASGIRVVGIDINQAMVDIARQHSVDLALNRYESGIEDRIMQFSRGLGCDGVIITAASDSLDPINFAGAISRKRGTIVVLGAVPCGFDREPHFYRKELQVKMSCSYGPGRYDPAFEEKGFDYPPAYVRWTENRNMQAFQDLIYSGKINLNYLTTHVFKLEDAPSAYDLILERSEPYIGILIEYDTSKPVDFGRVALLRSDRASRAVEAEAPKAATIGFIGAGSYAQSFLLPNIPKNRKDVILRGVMTATSTGSRSAADRFGFEFCTGNEQDILENQEINTIFIATRHNMHAELVKKSLSAGKHTFVEKPLCLSESELQELASLCQMSYRGEGTQPLLMVGYNRRFSPLAKMLKEAVGSGPMAMIYRVNAGHIPIDSWIQDPEIGGGRIIGEVCHFIDFLIFINGSLPTSIYAAAMEDAYDFHDTLSVVLSFRNGSIGTISYFANGDRGLPKEQIEVYAHGSVAVLHDFKSLTIYSHGKKKEKKLMSQDKGQREEIRLFLEAILQGKEALIPFEELYATSLTTFRIEESIRTGQRVPIYRPAAAADDQQLVISYN